MGKYEITFQKHELVWPIFKDKEYGFQLGLIEQNVRLYEGVPHD